MTGTDPTIRLLEELSGLDETDSAHRDELLGQIEQVAPTSLEQIETILETLGASRAGDDPLMARLLERLWMAWPETVAPAHLDEAAVRRVAELYLRFDANSPSRCQLLRMLATDGGGAALGQFAELVAADPPGRSQATALAFVPLFQRKTYAVSALFPRLLDGLEHPVAAAVTLDLTNYLTRHKLVEKHPASDRVGQLSRLLGELAGRLALLEEHPARYAASNEPLTQVIAEGLALVVSLCNALALIGDESVTGRLHQALGLSHRRVRTEAAAALAALGDEMGIEALAELAVQPVVRSRVLSCLEDLGQVDRAAERYRTPAARAEGELAAWMAQPSHFALPPDSLELVDTRRQRWPGYEQPVPCFLFRYEYRQAGSVAGGVGIVGPLTCAFRADLQDLPPEDIYAVYAGFSAEHGEIGETPAEQLSSKQQADWRQASDELAERTFSKIELVKFGHFFGQDIAVAMAQRQGRPGVLVVAEGSFDWYPMSGGRAPGPTEIYNMFKGRRLLKAFNAPGPQPG